MSLLRPPAATGSSGRLRWLASAGRLRWLASAVWLLPFAALGQGAVGPLEPIYRPTTSGPFVTFTAPITPAGRLVAQPILSVAFSSAAFDNQGLAQPFASGESALSSSLTLFAEYGLTDWLSAGSQLAVLHNRRSSPGEAADSTGLADALLFARTILLRETPAWPEVTVMGQLKLPTGNWRPAAGLLGVDVRGTGATDLTAALDLTKGMRPLLLHADLLLTQPIPARLDGVETANGTMLSWSASAEWPFLDGRFAAMAEVSGRHQAEQSAGGTKVAGSAVHELLVGAGLELILSDDVQVLIGYQRTVAGANVPVADAVIITVVPTVL